MSNKYISPIEIDDGIERVRRSGIYKVTDTQSVFGSRLPTSTTLREPDAGYPPDSAAQVPRS